MVQVRPPRGGLCLRRTLARRPRVRQAPALDATGCEGRICAVADVFDALLSDRPYRPALGCDEAREIIVEGRGRFFDPEILDLLQANFDECCAVREEPSLLLPAASLD
jgi:hypothetical protein